MQINCEWRSAGTHPAEAKWSTRKISPVKGASSPYVEQNEGWSCCSHPRPLGNLALWARAALFSAESECSMSTASATQRSLGARIFSIHRDAGPQERGDGFIIRLSI